MWGRFPGFGSNWGREGCSRLSHARRASHLLHETFPLTSYSRKLSSQRKLPLPWLRVTPGHKPLACSHPGVCGAMGPGCPVGPECPTGAHPSSPSTGQREGSPVLPHGSPTLGQPNSSPPSWFLLLLCPRWQHHPAGSCPRGVSTSSTTRDNKPLSLQVPLLPPPQTKQLLAQGPTLFGCENT